MDTYWRVMFKDASASLMVIPPARHDFAKRKIKKKTVNLNFIAVFPSDLVYQNYTYAPMYVFIPVGTLV